VESLRAQIREAWLRRLEEDPKVDRKLLAALREALPEDGILDRATLRTAIEQARAPK
jgi:hypothetical protein